MINKYTGEIEIKKGVIIKPYIPIEELEKNNFPIKSIDDMKTGWIWYRLKPIIINQLDWFFSFAFENNRLMQLSFAFHEQIGEKERTWDNWSEETEIELAKQYNSWLDKELDDKRNFDWGDAYAGYDQRSGCSEIIFRYRKS